MNRLSKSILALLLAGLVACQSTPPQEDVEQVVIDNVNVISMTSDGVTSGQSVVIRDGKIHQVAPSDEVYKGSKSTVIDGSGKYLTPGIAEMHAHIPNPQSTLDVEEVLFLYLSNGITVIRGMLGHESHLQLKKDVLSGKVLGPTIWTSSPSMNGNSIPTMEIADSMVRAHRQANYDFLKIHPGIKLEVFNKMVATANEVGIGYSGHVPVDVGVHRAIESKFGSIDHVDGFIRGLVPEESGLDLTVNDFFGMSFADDLDESRIDGLIDMTVQNQVWVVPTQTLFDRWASPTPAAEYTSEAGMQYLPKSTIYAWTRAKGNMLGDGYDADQWAKFNEVRRKLIKALNDRGHGLLLGSDAPQVFNVPGFSIQHEMKSMKDAGLSSYDILKSGTINIAKFFGEEGQYGQITEGARADLILLDANPLDDIGNMSKIQGVMVRGRWLDRNFIDTELQKIADKYADAD